MNRPHGPRVFALLAAVILCPGTLAFGQQPQTPQKPAAQSPAPDAAPVATPPPAVTPAAPVAPPATSPAAPVTPPKAVAPAVPTGVVPPPGYVIGPEDQLSIVFWREKDLSTDAAVRPDGKISIPLLNDLQAVGLTPDQLRINITEAAVKFVTDPTVTVVVKQINSRKVFITGQVPKPGPYPLGGPTTVLQLIATAGGVNEYADSEHIVILRTENGKPTSIEFNYKDVSKRKKLQQNIELKPGDTVIVP
jgi:polysaccharide export outer membrane protein